MSHELRRLPDGTVSHIDYKDITGATLAPGESEYQRVINEAAVRIGVAPKQIEANLAEGRWEVW